MAIPPARKCTAAPALCSASFASSGTKPTTKVPKPQSTSNASATRPNRVPRLQNKIAPAAIKIPCNANDPFITACHGEQTIAPHAVLPKSLMKFVRKL